MIVNQGILIKNKLKCNLSDFKNKLLAKLRIISHTKKSTFQLKPEQAI